MIDSKAEPVAVANLIKSVRRDGFKRYHDSARAELIEQARSGQYSIAKLARANGLNANMLHRWLDGVQPKKPGKKHTLQVNAAPLTSPALLPVVIRPVTPMAVPLKNGFYELALSKGTLRVPLDRVELSVLISLLS